MKQLHRALTSGAAVLALAAGGLVMASSGAASGTVRIQQVTRVGTAVAVRVSVPRSGGLVVMGARGSRKAIAPAERLVRGSGAATLTAPLTPTALAHLRRHSMRVCVAVRFRTPAGDIEATSRTVVLQRMPAVRVPVTG